MTDRPSDVEIGRAIDGLLAAREDDATICPSEVARALAPADRWRDLMDDVRRVAAAEHHAGRVEVRQGGARVDPATARGPIRLARVASPR
ncbi:MAG: DUF3253 domain-containing protein [Patulibacter minatonensis]